MIEIVNTDDGAGIAGFIILRVFLFIFGTAVTLISYIMTVREIKILQQYLGDKRNLKTTRMLVYPIVLFATLLPCNVHSFIRMCTNYEDIPIVEASVLLITHSLGFTNSLVYIVQRKLYINLDEDGEDETMDATKNKTMKESFFSRKASAYESESLPASRSDTIEMSRNSVEPNL